MRRFFTENSFEYCIGLSVRRWQIYREETHLFILYRRIYFFQFRETAIAENETYDCYISL